MMNALQSNERRLISSHHDGVIRVAKLSARYRRLALQIAETGNEPAESIVATVVNDGASDRSPAVDCSPTAAA